MVSAVLDDAVQHRRRRVWLVRDWSRQRRVVQLPHGGCERLVAFAETRHRCTPLARRDGDRRRPVPLRHGVADGTLQTRAGNVGPHRDVQNEFPNGVRANDGPLGGLSGRDVREDLVERRIGPVTVRSSR